MNKSVKVQDLKDSVRLEDIYGQPKRSEHEFQNERTVVHVGDFIVYMEITQIGRLIITIDSPDNPEKCVDILVPRSCDPEKVIVG